MNKFQTVFCHGGSLIVRLIQFQEGSISDYLDNKKVTGHVVLFFHEEVSNGELKYRYLKKAI
jgi:hypothetical protein